MSGLGIWLDDFLRTLLFLPEQASTRAAAIDHLHFLVIGISSAVAGVIALATAVFAWRYRRRPGRQTATRRLVAPMWLELSVYGAILTGFLAFWWIGIGQYVDMGRSPEGALEVYVTAKQWMWKFAYPSGASSTGVLYVPAGRPVRLLITSRDVIHSFYVPDFRLKRDAVPGRYTGIWFEAPRPGRHTVLCAEMCGTGHSVMQGEVVVLPRDEFEGWLRGKAPDPGEGGADLVERGRRASAEQGCLQCHSTDGTRGVGPTWQDVYGSEVVLEDGSRQRVDEAYLTRSMMDPRVQIVQGYPPVMPSYRGQLPSEDAASIVEFIKSLRGGPGGDGPRDVAPAAGAEGGAR